MRYLASLAIWVSLVVCSSAGTIPGLFIVDNIVDFCAFETYVSQFTSRLSYTGKLYYDKGYHDLVQEMSKYRREIFSNIIATHQAQIGVIVTLEQTEFLVELGRRLGYDRPDSTDPYWSSAGFTLCKYQTDLKDFVQKNLRTPQGGDAMRVIINQFFSDLIAKHPENLKKISDATVAAYSVIPSSDYEYFAQIALAYGVSV